MRQLHILHLQERSLGSWTHSQLCDSYSQVAFKKDNGKTAMVPAFQSLETIAGEVLTVVFLACCAMTFGMDS